MPELGKKNAIEILCKYWRVEEFSFLGEFILPSNSNRKNVSFGYITNLRANDRSIYYPPQREGQDYDNRVLFKVHYQDWPELEPDRKYWIELELADDRDRIQNPFALRIKNITPIRNDVKSPQEFIQDWFFKKGENPGDAATIASQLKLNELELYTHTKRFIFELIQNADDMPSGNKPVDIQIYLLQNHLLFLHNGKFFDREDVMAISDAAKSTKSGNTAQTGYKGIGFKSVFTDSTRVYIKSADYSFKFDKLDHIYKDFWSLYRGYSDMMNPQAKQAFKEDYKGKEAEFTQIDRIPWQIKPIWVDRRDYPNALTSSPFGKNHEVAIALEIGQGNIENKGYHEMINTLLSEPRFLLFLRNTRSLEYERLYPESTEAKRALEIDKHPDGTEVYANGVLSSAFLSHDFPLQISNENFEASGFDFKRRILEGNKVEFVDLEGRKLANIPEKLGHLERTILTFSAKTNSRNEVERLPLEESILFNYLPTSDQRFGFPFLVNADFVSKSDREFIQIENAWNHFLFYHIGFSCLEWAAKLASVVDSSPDGRRAPKYLKSYLNIVPRKLLEETNEELLNINKAFNLGVKKALQEVPFILDYRLSLCRTDQIVLDETGVSGPDVLGIAFFEEISGSSKSLPHLLIDKSSLRHPYLQIERFEFEHLLKKLSSDEGRKAWMEAVAGLSEMAYPQLLAWLNQKVGGGKISKDFIVKLPILRIMQGSVRSLEESIQTGTEFLKWGKIVEIEFILATLGFAIAPFSLDDYPHILAAIQSQKNYLGNDLLLLSRIEQNASFEKLRPRPKSKLVTFLSKLEGVGPKTITSIPLFKTKDNEDNEDKLFPIEQLVTSHFPSPPAWLYPYIIEEEEETALEGSFSKYLIALENLFVELLADNERFGEITSALEEGDLPDFYAFLIKVFNAGDQDTYPPFAAISWIYANQVEAFLPVASIYCPDSLHLLDRTKFEQVAKVLQACSKLILPSFEALGFLKVLKIDPIAGPFCKHFALEVEFELDIVLAFLDWAISNKEEALFSKIQIQKRGDYFVLSEGSGIIYFSTDTDVIDFISKQSKPDSYFLLPSELYCKGLDSLGLLEGEKLILHLLKNEVISIGFIRLIKQYGMELKKLFVQKLAGTSLASDVIYEENSEEHLLMKLVIDLGKEDEELYQVVGRKLNIDGKGLEKANYSNDVTLKLGHPNAESPKSLRFSLSDLIGETVEPVSKVLDSFLDLSGAQKASLKKNLFHLRQMSNEEISGKMFSSPKIEWTVNQFAFLIVLSFKDQKKLELGNKTFLQESSAARSNEDCEKLKNLLDFFYSHDLEFFSVQFHILEFNFSQMILDDDFALETERSAAWLREWTAEEDGETKYRFLEKCGANGRSSSVCLLRNALKVGDEEELKQNLYKADLTREGLINSAEWLMEQAENESLELQSTILDLLYKQMATKKITAIEIPIASLVHLTPPRKYKLIPFDSGLKYHRLNGDWGEYEHEIFISVRNEGGIVLDSIMPESMGITAISASPMISANETALISGSEPFRAPFYYHWEHREKVPIMIFSGDQIPRVVEYDGMNIANSNDGKYEWLDDHHYVCKPFEAEIPDILEELSHELKRSLQRALYEQRNVQGGSKIDDNLLSEIELEELNCLLEQPLSDNDAANIWIVAAFRAIKYYETQGWNLDGAREEFPSVYRTKQIVGAIDPDGNLKTILIRSARSKLLRLSYKAWLDLGKEGFELWVNTGNLPTDVRIFADQEELAGENEDAWVLKLVGEDKKSILDSLLRGQFAKKEFEYGSLAFFIRLKGNTESPGIFEGIYQKQRDQIAETDDFQ